MDHYGPSIGCGVGTRVPVAPSPALSAGLVALVACARRNVHPRPMESALAVTPP